MAPEAPKAPVERRSFLNWLLGSWAAGVAAAVGFPVVRYLQPPNIPEPTTASTSGGKASSLLPNTFRIVPFGAKPAIVIREASGDLKALSATCTHLSCTVQYRGDMSQIWCACHNGRYDLTGKNVAGPPPRPLESFDVSVHNDEILISRRA
jgi:Rieske Fe-S protein